MRWASQELEVVADKVQLPRLLVQNCHELAFNPSLLDEQPRLGETQAPDISRNTGKLCLWFFRGQVKAISWAGLRTSRARGDA